MTEFYCTDCGYHIFRFAGGDLFNDNEPIRCAACQWLAVEVTDPVERDKLRKYLNRWREGKHERER